MEWHREIAVYLPDQNADEPVNLRQEISDELSDHLQCSLNRELLHEADEATARRRVLDQFGDVSGTARRLWLHAMKYRLLRQRILVGTSVVTIVALILVCALAWSHIRQLEFAVDSALHQSGIAMQELQRAQDENSRLLARIARVSAAAMAARPGGGSLPLSSPQRPQTRVQLSESLQNPDMEDGSESDLPIGWTYRRDQPSISQVSLDNDQPFSGKTSAKIDSTIAPLKDGERRFTNFSQVVSATQYRGKRIRFTAAVRTESDDAAKTQLWLRVDGKPVGGRPNTMAFDNMGDRPIETKEWKHFEIVLPVAESAEAIIAGVFVIGRGKAWIDDASIEVVDDDTPTTGGSVAQAAVTPEVAHTEADVEAPSEQSNGDAAGDLVADRPAIKFPSTLQNPAFEDGKTGWMGQYSIDQNAPKEGSRAALLDSTNRSEEAASQMTGVSQLLDAATYRGKRIRFRVAVRTQAEESAKVHLWCRVDRKAKANGRSVVGAFDNMNDRPIDSADWKHFDIVLQVDRDAEKIMFGGFIVGQGKVWIDDASFEVVDGKTPLTGTGVAPPQPFFVSWLWLVVITLSLFGISQRTRTDEAGKSVDPGFATKAAFRFSVAYWLLYSLPQPFTSLIPGFGWVGAAYKGVVDSAVRWAAPNLLDIQRTLVAPNGSGDTTYAYVQLFLTFTLALIVAAVWSLVDRRKTDYRWTKDLLGSYLRYVLALTMLGYGLSKIGFAYSQFPEPGIHQLMKPYGDSSPMNLVWTFMGASRPYTIFSGVMEVLCALLLIWRRTASLGAIVSVGVMLNVVMLNFCYDVPVKQYSAHLLCMGLYLLLPDMQRLMSVLILNRPTQTKNMSPPYTTGRAALWIHRGLKLAVIMIGFAIPLWGRVQMEVAHSQQKASVPAFFGDFKIESFTRNGKELSVEDGSWRSVSFDRRPYGPKGQRVPTNYITIGFPQSAIWNNAFQLSEESSTLTLTSNGNSSIPAEMKMQKDGEDSIELSGNTPTGPIVVKLQRYADDDFLLTGRGFRWINEVPFNR